MTEQEKIEYMRWVYRAAVGAGIVKTNKDMADMMGIDRSSLSGAINGRKACVTDSMFMRFRAFAVEHDLKKPQERRESAEETAVPVSRTLVQCIDELSRTVAQQAVTIEGLRQQLSQVLRCK